MSKNPKPTDQQGTGPPEPYVDKLGPIPPEHLENDFRFNPDVDKSEGSLYQRASKRIKSIIGSLSSLIF